MNKNFLGIKTPNFLFSFLNSKSSKPNLRTQGITNKTEDRKFVLFADYDEVNLQSVEEDLLFLQKNYKIGDAIIVCSSNQEISETGKIYGNYYIIAFTKLEFPELLEILKNLRCDWHFKRGWRYQYRSWVLRTTEKRTYKGEVVKLKPKLVTFMPSFSSREYSKSHVEFFEQLYNFKIKRKSKNFDKGKFVEVINYVTR